MPMQSPSENDKRLSSERTLLGVLPQDPYIGQEKQESIIAKKKKEIFEKVVTTVNACFDGNHQK